MWKFEEQVTQVPCEDFITLKVVHCNCNLATDTDNLYQVVLFEPRTISRLQRGKFKSSIHL